MKKITYRLTLKQPVLVTSLDGDPNSAVAFPYIPGSVLRGAVIGKYLAQESGRKIDPGNSEDARRFFNASVRYLNGYLVKYEVRALPVPLSWQMLKAPTTDDDKRIIYDGALLTLPNKRLKSVSKPFWILQDGKVINAVEPERQLAVHTQRARPDDDKVIVDDKVEKKARDFGRPRTNSGAVYRYESLAVGQTFEAIILCDKDEDATFLMGQLQGDLFIGGSRSAGYGHVTIEQVKVSNQDQWREISGTLSVASDRLIITLLSDALVRDEQDEFAVTVKAVKSAIEKQLGKGVTLHVVEDRCFMRGTVVGGFNRKWGLPLPQTPAVSMGSVFVFEMHMQADTGAEVGEEVATSLATLEWHGIGERRAEGFGRLIVNWQTQPELIVFKAENNAVESKADAEQNHLPPNLISLAESDETEHGKTAQRMIQRLTHRKLDAKIVQMANKLTISNPPSAAQLSRLRAIIQNILLSKEIDLKRLDRFIENIGERGIAYRQFNRARCDGKSLLDWIVSTRDMMTFDTPSDEKLPLEYALRLIDAVLDRAIKELQRKERNG